MAGNHSPADDRGVGEEEVLQEEGDPEEDVQDEGDQAKSEQEGGDHEEEGSGSEDRAGKRSKDDEQAVVDSSEEDSDEENSYDYNDKFLAGDDEEEEEEGDAGEGSEEERRRKKHKRRRDFQLEEEDYQLLEDNEVKGVRRPKPSQRRRIRKMSDSATVGRSAYTKDQLEKEIFGGDDGLEDEEGEDLGRVGGAEDRADGSDDFLDEEEDEMAGFIVDEDGGGGGRRRRRSAGLLAPLGTNVEALDEVHALFADGVDEMLAMYESQARNRGVRNEDEELVEPAEDDEEAHEAYMAAVEERAQRRQRKAVVEAIEPGVMAAAMLRPEDDAIRAVDAPERHQLRRLIPLAGGFNRSACAMWIAERLVLGRHSLQRLEKMIVEDGVREVDKGAGSAMHNVSLEAEDVPPGRRTVTKQRDRDQRHDWRMNHAAQIALQGSIEAVLAEIFENDHEVPFVATYRKQVCGELLCTRAEDAPEPARPDERRRRGEAGGAGIPSGCLTAAARRLHRWDVLWLVTGWAARWRALARRKEARAAAYEAAAAAAPLPQERDAVRACCAALDAAASMEDVDDVDVKFQLVTGTAGIAEDVATLTVDAPPASQRRPMRASQHRRWQQAGLGVVVTALGMTAEQLGENLDLSYRKHEPNEDDQRINKMTPGQLASEHIVPGTPYSSPEAVLSGARQMAAVEVMSEPKVRDAVRHAYFEAAVLSTEPTEAGEAAIDPFHMYGRFKRLRNKPVDKVWGTDDFLYIAQADKDGLLRYKIELPEDEREKLMGQLREAYVSSGVSIISQEWNKLRKAILEEAIEQRLAPAMAREVEARLLAEARDAALRKSSDALWALATRGPLQVRVPDEDEVVEKRRFLAVVWGPGDPATTLAMLDDTGALIDVLFAGQLSGPQRRPQRAPDAYDLFADPRKARDAARVRELVLEHKPHVVLVGGANLWCRALREDLGRVRDHILDTMPRALTRSDTGDIDVRLADESLAAAWAASPAAAAELPEQPPLVRRAVALGRCALDPLAMVAALAGSPRDLAALGLHPLQNALPRAEMAAAAERVLVTATCQVGADINRMAVVPWQAAPLQYVAGLGPRKAQALLRAVQRCDGGVLSRKALFRELHILGRNVFRNAAGFLRIRSSGRDMDNAELDALDDSRIHPDAYRAATALAAAAAGLADPADPIAVERAMALPAAVEAADLQDVQSMLEGGGQFAPGELTTLVDISFELVAPFQDLRPEARPPTEEEVFWMLSGESAGSLRVGQRVDARVAWVGAEECRCELPGFGGLEAVLGRDDVSAAGPVDPRDRVQRGAALAARVKEIEPGEWRVALTTSSADLNNEAEWEERYCAGADRFYVIVSPADREREAAAKARAARARHLAHRPIRHPNFKNVSMAAATELLDSADMGECLLRPSPKGAHLICLTIKVHTGRYGPLYVHLDVKEGAKGRGLGSHLQLGTPLTLTTPAGSEAFEDLDEIVARYVEPYAVTVRSITTHRKFRDGHWPDIAAALRSEKARAPRGQSVYCLGIKYDTPGMFYLAFVLPTATATPHREYFLATPKGPYFRSKVWKTVDHVIAEFKKVPDPKQRARAAPPGPPGANMAPLPPYGAPPQYPPAQSGWGMPPPAVPAPVWQSGARAGWGMVNAGWGP